MNSNENSSVLSKDSTTIDDSKMTSPTSHNKELTDSANETSSMLTKEAIKDESKMSSLTSRKNESPDSAKEAMVDDEKLTLPISNKNELDDSAIASVFTKTDVDITPKENKLTTTDSSPVFKASDVYSRLKRCFSVTGLVKNICPEDGNKTDRKTRGTDDVTIFSPNCQRREILKRPFEEESQPSSNSSSTVSLLSSTSGEYDIDDNEKENTQKLI